MKPPPPKIEGVVFTQDSLGNRGVVGHDVYVNLLAHLAVRNTRKKVDKMALVTDFPRSLLFRMMEVYRIRFEWFDAIVAHGDCDMDPASPERYLKAMEEMGLAEQPFN